MALTFINLCNKTLRRLNEVEIPEGGFNNTRGVQALVKDAVRNSIAHINQSQFEWPFNAAEETGTLTIGQTEYSFPASFQSVDWDSFQIVPGLEGTPKSNRLMYMDRDVWYNTYRDTDDDAVGVGIGMPRYVFRSHGLGFGVSPSPDQEYRIQFRYYLNLTILEDAEDVTRIPDDFERVIVDGAMYHMYMFKDNIESAGAAYDVFQQGIKNLRTIYINSYESIRDTRVNFGGGRSTRFSI
jgi:hypothetical protein